MAWACILVLCVMAGGLDLLPGLSVLELFSAKQEQWLYLLKVLVLSAGNRSHQSCLSPVRRKNLSEIDLCDQISGVLWVGIAEKVWKVSARREMINLTRPQWESWNDPWRRYAPIQTLDKAEESRPQSESWINMGTSRSPYGPHI